MRLMYCLNMQSVTEGFARYQSQRFISMTISVRIFMRCGIVPDLIRKKTGRMGNEFALALQQCGIYTLTVGSIFRGILDIYGTTNHAGVIYWWGGIGLFAVGILMECILHGKN